jgi:hypothetical protein
MDQIKLTANSPANVPEFESEIKTVGGAVTGFSGNVIEGIVPNGKTFFERIADNPRFNKAGSSITVPPPPINPLEAELVAANDALAAEKAAHAETQAALATAQAEISSVRAHNEAIAAELAGKSTAPA